MRKGSGCEWGGRGGGGLFHLLDHVAAGVGRRGGGWGGGSVVQVGPCCGWGQAASGGGGGEKSFTFRMTWRLDLCDAGGGGVRVGALCNLSIDVMDGVRLRGWGVEGRSILPSTCLMRRWRRGEAGGALHRHDDAAEKVLCRRRGGVGGELLR